MKDNKILLGWQFLDPEKHAYLTPWVSNGQFSGNSLQLKEIELPGEQDNRWDVWGYCVGDIRDGDRIKHYQSDPFNLVVTAGEPVSEPKEIPSAVKEGKCSFAVVLCIHNSLICPNNLSHSTALTAK
ncbi:unnamed protein product [Trichobilharzia regenti]|nr:unnamed protein product [Trichobilharzia regenti]